MNPWHRYLHQYFTGKSDEEAVDSFNIWTMTQLFTRDNVTDTEERNMKELKWTMKLQHMLVQFRSSARIQSNQYFK
jgi:hypothetical protein